MREALETAERRAIVLDVALMGMPGSGQAGALLLDLGTALAAVKEIDRGRTPRTGS